MIRNIEEAKAKLIGNTAVIIDNGIVINSISKIMERDEALKTFSDKRTMELMKTRAGGLIYGIVGTVLGEEKYIFVFVETKVDEY